MLLRILFACCLLSCCQSLSATKPKSHPVNSAELLEQIGRADEVVVEASSHLNWEVVYSSSDSKDLAELQAAISIEAPDGELHCLCLPTTRIQLRRKHKELGTILVYPGATTISLSIWSSDARILDKEKWLQWFDARKIAGPRKEAQEQAEIEKQDQAYEERWTAAMPPSLRPGWTKVIADIFPGQQIDTTPLDQELAKELPDANKRILALMSWFGSGAGRWSGFPSYESVAEEMLLKYPTAELLVAVKDRVLTEPELEGAARLFAGWEFNQRRPEDIHLLPGDLKRTLLEHSLKSNDEDKVGRAQYAFEHN